MAFDWDFGGASGGFIKAGPYDDAFEELQQGNLDDQVSAVDGLASRVFGSYGNLADLLGRKLQETQDMHPEQYGDEMIPPAEPFTPPPEMDWREQQRQQRLEANRQADISAARSADEAGTTNPLALPFGAWNAAEDATRIPYLSDFIEQKLRPAAADVFNASPVGGSLELARGGLGKLGLDVPDAGETLSGLIPSTGLDIGMTAAPLAGEIGRGTQLARDIALDRLTARGVPEFTGSSAFHWTPDANVASIQDRGLDPGSWLAGSPEEALRKARLGNRVSNALGLGDLSQGSVMEFPVESGGLRPARTTALREEAYRANEPLMGGQVVREGVPFRSPVAMPELGSEFGGVRMPGDSEDLFLRPQEPTKPLPGQSGLFGEGADFEAKLPPRAQENVMPEEFRGEQGFHEPGMFSREETGQTGQMGMEEALRPQRIVIKASDLEYRPDLFQTRDADPGKPFAESRVKFLEEHWDPSQFETPRVVADPEKPGKYIVTVGQHRSEAFMRKVGRDAPIEVSVMPHDISDPAQLAKAQLEADASNATTKPLNVREEVRNLRRAENLGENPQQIAGRLGKSDAYVEKLQDVARVGGQAVDRVTQEPALFDLATEIGRGMRFYGINEEDANGLFSRIAGAAKGQRPTVTALRETIDRFGKALAEAPQSGLFDTGQFEGMRSGLLGLIDENARARTQLTAQLNSVKRAQTNATKLATLPGATDADRAAGERLVTLGKAEESRLRDEIAANEEDIGRAMRGEPTSAVPAAGDHPPAQLPDKSLPVQSEPPRRELELSGQEPPSGQPPSPPSRDGGMFPPGEGGGGPARMLPSRTLKDLFGIETPTAQLATHQNVLDIVNDTISKALPGARREVDEGEQAVTGAFKTLREGRQNIDAQANRFGAVSAQIVKEGGFDLDEAGRIASLPGKPTLQDVAARLPDYRDLLTPTQELALEELRAEIRPFAQALKEQGVEFGSRADVQPGGFYLPRGRADVEGADEALPLGGPRRLGSKKGFERGATFESMRQGIEGGYKYAPLADAMEAYARDAGNRALDAFTADYLKGAGSAETIPQGGTLARGRHTINDFSGLQGYSFPDEVASAANKYIKGMQPPSGAGAGALKAVNATNNLLRGVRATADVSWLGIQGLLGLGHDPQAYGQALKVALKSVGDRDALGAFLRDFDRVAETKGLPSSKDWIAAGLRVGGRDTEFEIGKGLGERVARLPVVEQANRTFGYFGDVQRTAMAEDIFENKAALRDLTGDDRLQAMREIANGTNLLTGWSRGRFGGDYGNLAQFAPRFFQSQLELVAKAFTDGSMTGDIARKSLVKLIGYGTLITIGANEALGNKGFDYLTPLKGGELNPNFMRIRVLGNDVSLFGPWDSLLRGVVAAGGGDLGYLARTKASPTVGTAIDLIHGRTFTGQPVGGAEASGVHTGNARYWLRNLLPFSLSRAGKENAFGTAVGLTGLKSSPLTRAEQALLTKPTRRLRTGLEPRQNVAPAPRRLKVAQR